MTPAPTPFLQVGRAVLMENDETGQANEVGEEEEGLGGKGRGPGGGWEERGKEKFLRGTSKYARTRPVRGTAALSVAGAAERLRSAPRPRPRPCPQRHLAAAVR